MTRHPQDGTVFQNREALLPKLPAGYHKEYTADNPAVSGRSEERMVVGVNGEAYYSPSHDQSFVRIR